MTCECKRYIATTVFMLADKAPLPPRNKMGAVPCLQSSSDQDQEIYCFLVGTRAIDYASMTLVQPSQALESLNNVHS